jgi:hypothetical protein
VAAPSDEALQTVLHKIITRGMKLLTRCGALVEEQGSTYMADNDADSDEARTLRPLQAAACIWRIAFGPRAGQKVLTVQVDMNRCIGRPSCTAESPSAAKGHRVAADVCNILKPSCIIQGPGMHATTPRIGKALPCSSVLLACCTCWAQGEAPVDRESMCTACCMWSRS